MPNAWPEQFVDLLESTSGLVLDCGAGDRTDPRVIALEYDEYASSTIRGDGVRLPFRDETFALVLSQAVLEHVVDPQAHVDEIVRVLAPGGLFVCEAAFMQPIHLAPRHYFGITGYGLSYLCRALQIIECVGMGSMVESWDWVGGEAGARQALTEREFATVRSMMAKVDARISPEQLWRVAPGVHLLGRKPG